MDALVKITESRSVTGFDPKTLLPSKHIQTTFTVGDHGPFVITTPPDHFTPEYVDQVTGKTADTLRASGALKES